MEHKEYYQQFKITLIIGNFSLKRYSFTIETE